MATGKCPCGSGHSLETCCGPFLSGDVLPETAEQLMRSRYTAYTQREIGYLKQTLWPKHQAAFDFAATQAWATQNHWTGLRVLETLKGAASDREGLVLFEASYLTAGALQVHRENSRFRKKSGRWFYVEAV